MDRQATHMISPEMLRMLYTRICLGMCVFVQTHVHVFLILQVAQWGPIWPDLVKLSVAPHECKLSTPGCVAARQSIS